MFCTPGAESKALCHRSVTEPITNHAIPCKISLLSGYKSNSDNWLELGVFSFG